MELEHLLIEKASKTPLIDLNPLNGDLILEGKSIPENAAKIYEPVFNWVAEYIKDARPITNLRFNLEYFNTSSSLWIVKILKLLIQINDPEYVLIIHLYLPIEDFQEIEDMGDLKDAFAPIASIFDNAIPNIGIKLYGTSGKGEIIKDTLLYF